MAKKQFGMHIAISADARKFIREMGELKAETKVLNEGLKSINKIKLTPNGIKEYIESQKRLSKEVKEAEEKFKSLKKAEKELKEQFKSGKMPVKEFNLLQKEIQKTASQMNELKKNKMSLGNVAGLLKGNLSGVRSAFKAVGATVMATTGLIATAVATMTKITLDSAKFADDILTMSKVTGLSTQELQEFSYASDLVDVSLDTLAGSYSKLTKNMYNAQKGNADQVRAFELLSVAYTNADGTLRDKKVVFGEVIDALGKMTNETERDAIAMQLFGKSATELNPLILEGSEGLKKLTAEAHANGLIMGDEMLDSLGSVDDSFQRLNQSIKGISRIMGGFFANTLDSVLKRANKFVVDFFKAFKTGDSKQMKKVVVNMFKDMGKAIDEMLPMLVDSVFNLLLNLIEFLSENSGEFFNGVFAYINLIFQKIVERIPELIPHLLNIIINLITQLIANLPSLIGTFLNLMIKIIVAILSTVGTAFLSVGEYVAQVLSEIVVAIFDIIYDEFTKGVNFIADIVKWFVDAFNKKKDEFINIGKNIVKGIWDGIGSLKDWLFGKVGDFFGGIVTWGKKALRINSPSLVFKDMGINVGKGFQIGIDKSFKDVNGSIVKNFSKVINTSTNLTQNISVSAMNEVDLGIQARLQARKLLLGV